MEHKEFDRLNRGNRLRHGNLGYHLDLVAALDVDDSFDPDYYLVSEHRLEGSVAM
jgi:hypothetical protein